MIRFVRVALPINSPEGTLKLSKKISDKHTADGAASQLNGFLDMAEFELKRADAANKQEMADARMRTSQAKYGQLKTLCGISEGQNKQTRDTVYWYVLQIRDVLAIKNRGVEENLSEWGFNVVVSQTGARRNVRIEIPRGVPEDLKDLAAAIKAKHLALLLTSPLIGSGVDMTDYGTKTDSAVTLVSESQTAAAEAQALHGQALMVMGYADGQLSTTPGTLYFDLITIRERLLQANQDEEENLSLWGFTVVITAKSVGRKKGEGNTFTIQVSLPAGEHVNLDFTEIEGDGTPLSVEFGAEGSNADYYASATIDGAVGANPVLSVTAGNKVIKAPEQVSSELGLGDLKPFLMVRNSGTTNGTFKVKFRFPPE